MVCLDIDHIPELMKKSRWTSYNRFNWASFQERDHFGDPMLSLRQRLENDASSHGILLPDGPIFLVTHLRYLNYCFNPISFYFCYGQDGKLGAVLAAVNSTFGERHNYWLGAQNQQPSANSLRYSCPKMLHVSPFMAMNLDYDFVLTEPKDKFVAHMNTIERDAVGETSQCLLDATLTLERQPWTSRNMARALLRHPWMTAKVIGAIHWQALRLFLKRVPVFTHPDRLRSRSQGV